MKLLLLITSLIFCPLAITLLNAQAVDSTTHIITVPAPVLIESAKDDLQHINDDDFSPGIGFFVLLALGAVLVFVGMGIAFTIIGLLIIFGFVSIGLLSASIIVGIHKKSFTKGFKMFLVSMSTAGGGIIFSVMFLLVNLFTNTHSFSNLSAFAMGGVFGVLAGFVFGYLAFFILQKLTTYLKRLLSAD